MTPEEIINKLDILTADIEKLKKQSKLPDHFHNGFDVSRVKFQDIDTVFYAQSTINPSSLLDGAGEIKTATVNGANLGDFVLIAPPYDLQGITVTGWVSSSSTVSIRIQNESGGTLDLASGIWRILVIRKII
ncbi:hypothetical protein HY967_01580 [Candidatus Jorgensenbacteria bacterium]|nr:hypothetical protein [Candidatus Jorgensenbacteria bacterium]